MNSIKAMHADAKLGAFLLTHKHLGPLCAGDRRHVIWNMLFVDMMKQILCVFSFVILLGGYLIRPVAGQTAIWEQKYEIFENACEPNGGGPPVLEFASGPNGHLYFSDPGRLFRSIDGGENWEVATFPIVHIQGIVTLSSSEMLIGVYGQTPGVYRVTDNGDEWVQTEVVELINELVATDDRSIVFAIAAETGLYVTDDLGESWELTEEQRDISAIRVGPTGRMFMLAGLVFVSEDGMDWTTFASSKFPFPTSDPNVLLASENDGVYRSIDHGQSWALVLPFDRPNLLRNTEDVVIAVSKDAEVALTKDNGASWIPMIAASQLPCGARSAVSVDDAGHLWLGSDVGVIFRSSQTTHVATDPIATIPDNESLSVYPNPTSSAVNVVLNRARPGFLHLRVFDVLGREVHSFKSTSYGAEEVRYSWNTENIPAGVYLVRLDLTHAIKTQLVTVAH